jgi:hypothetical protein
MRNHMRWKAATTQLVLERINPESDRELLVYNELLNGLGGIILNCLEPFITSNDIDSCFRNLGGILRFAIKLDGKNKPTVSTTRSTVHMDWVQDSLPP